MELRHKEGELMLLQALKANRVEDLHRQHSKP